MAPIVGPKLAGLWESWRGVERLTRASNPRSPSNPRPIQKKLQDMRALLQHSATGRDALAYLEKEKVPVDFADNSGAYWAGPTRHIVVDRAYNTDFAALSLVHEAHHARMYLAKTTGDVIHQPRGDYVTSMVNEEATATALSIKSKRELVAAGQSVATGSYMEPQYGTAYAAAVAKLKMQNPAATAVDLATTGEAAGLQRTTQGFAAGQVPTSTTGESYPVFYQKSGTRPIFRIRWEL